MYLYMHTHPLYLHIPPPPHSTPTVMHCIHVGTYYIHLHSIYFPAAPFRPGDRIAVIMTSRKGGNAVSAVGGGDCYSGPYPMFERQSACSLGVGFGLKRHTSYFFT